MNVNTTLTEVIPPAKISTFKQGEFAGQFADNYGEEVDLKTFKGVFKVERTQKSHKLPKMTDIGPIVEETYGLTQPYASLSDQQREAYKNRLMEDNFHRIKSDIDLLLTHEFNRFELPEEPLQQLKSAPGGPSFPTLTKTL